MRVSNYQSPWSWAEEDYLEEVEDHGPIVDIYFPGGDISRVVVEFQDGFTLQEGDPDEPARYS